ncbi:MAG: permease-like cell division protein FtsX [Oscillospiraceae bacterium]|jgi:cell division transport system permease protein|nr:permease-like cell division protein FtsX [Oscillospiraceae bacterium]
MGFMNKIGYLLKEGFRSITAHGFMSFASVTIIVACLVIMGSFSLLAVNIDALINKLERENEMLAFVNEDYTEQEARAVQPALEVLPNISRVEFITREQAMANFKQDYENSALFDEIDPSILRDRYVVYLDDINLMADTKAELERVAGIADVSAQLEIAKGFVTARNIVGAVSLVLVVILFVVSVFIMSNTVKLTTFGRREEIAIMKMVGATNSFIRTPFVIEGLSLGVIGAGLALAIEWGIYTLLTDKIMTNIVGTFVSVITFSVLALPVAAVFLGVGIVVGTFGGTIAIRNYLKI